MDDTPFGKYRPVVDLGHGGMADVFLALSQGPVGFNKLVVIKRLRSSLMDDPEFVAMLLDEARLAARLNHPNIVQTNEVGEIDGQFFIAMEYLEGQPYSRILRRAAKKGEMSLDTHVRILADVLAGLHYAHELTDFDGTPLQVVHRDVTPSNVFITYEGYVKVVDFGVAKAAGRSNETKTGIVKGKVTYMAPEQAQGQEVDARADVFSVGVMLWETLVGKSMWEGQQDVVVVNRLLHHELPPSPIEVNPEVDPALNEICKKALAAEASDRYENAATFQAALEGYLEAKASTVSPRDIGKAVNELFGKKREEMKLLIDQQLAKIKASPESSIKPVTLRSTGTMDSLRLPPGLEDSSVDPQRVEATVAEVSPPAKRGGAPWLLAAAGLVAVGAVVWIASQSGNSEAADNQDDAAEEAQETARGADDAPTATAPGEGGEDPENPLATVRLRASPDSARFKIGDGEWLSNPYAGELPQDGKRYRVLIEADGYESKEVEVVLNKDVMLDVTLEEQRRTVIVAVPQKPPPEDKAPTGEDPTPSTIAGTPPKPPPVRPLDETDPWASKKKPDQDQP